MSRHHNNYLGFDITTGSGKLIFNKNIFGGLAFVFILGSAIVGSIGVLLLLLFSKPVHSGAGVSNWPVLAFVITGAVFVSLFAFILIKAAPAQLTSSVQFMLNDRTTIVTYMGLFHRQLPALPDKIEIGGGPPRAVWANLRYDDIRFKIPVLMTPHGVVDTDKEAYRLAMTETQEIREVLNIKNIQTTLPK